MLLTKNGPLATPLVNHEVTFSNDPSKLNVITKPQTNTTNRYHTVFPTVRVIEYDSAFMKYKKEINRDLNSQIITY